MGEGKEEEVVERNKQEEPEKKHWMKLEDEDWQIAHVERRTTQNARRKWA